MILNRHRFLEGYYKNKKILKKEVKDKVDINTFDTAIKDIEDELIVKKDEIYGLDKTNPVNENDTNEDLKLKFLKGF